MPQTAPLSDRVRPPSRTAPAGKQQAPADSSIAPASAASSVRPSAPPAPATTGSLTVESQPTGAHILFDGEAIGDTPLLVTDITPGSHQIALNLEAKGYRVWTGSIAISAGAEEKLLAVMTRVPAKH